MQTITDRILADDWLRTLISQRTAKQCMSAVQHRLQRKGHNERIMDIRGAIADARRKLGFGMRGAR